MRVRGILTVGAATAALGVAGGAAIASATGGDTMRFASAQLASVQPASVQSTTAASSSQATCDDGSWVGQDGLRVEGAPDTLDAGDRGATYVWHDSSGWHIRSTDPAGQSARYSGVLRLTRGATFRDVDTVRLERDDHVVVLDQGTVLLYSFATYSGVDGVDFHVSACAGNREHEAITFSMRRNRSDDDASRIVVGDHRQHPDSSTWRAFRQV